MKKLNTEDAVSPVVGVMLMLVVTIIIAAVVAAFAGGLATDTESTPTAILGVDDYTLTYYDSGYGYNYDLTNMSVKNKGGDILSTADLAIILETGLASKTYKFTEMGFVVSLGSGDQFEINKAEGSPNYGLVSQSVYDGYTIKWSVIYIPSGSSISSGSFVISTSNAKIIDKTV